MQAKKLSAWNGLDGDKHIVAENGESLMTNNSCEESKAITIQIP